MSLWGKEYERQVHSGVKYLPSAYSVLSFFSRRGAGVSKTENLSLPWEIHIETNTLHSYL